jgi:hypothetical protein
MHFIEDKKILPTPPFSKEGIKDFSPFGKGCIDRGHRLQVFGDMGNSFS